MPMDTMLGEGEDLNLRKFTGFAKKGTPREEGLPLIRGANWDSQRLGSLRGG